MKLSTKFKESAKELKNIRSLAIMAMLIALCVIFEKFLVIPIVGNIKQIKLTIIPAAISGMLFGPIAGTIVVAAGDLIANIEMFSPLYSLSAIVTGLICGCMFYRQPKIGLKRIIVGVSLITVLVYMVMNSCWVAFYGGLKKEWALLFRILTILVQYPVDIVCVYVVFGRLYKIPFMHPFIFGEKRAVVKANVKKATEELN